MRKRTFLLLAVLYAWPGKDGKSQSTQIAPDCSIPFSFTTAAQRVPASGYQNFSTSGQSGCVVWVVSYRSQGFSALSLQVDSAADTVSGSTHVPDTWGAFSGAILDGNAAGATSGPGVNPNTDTNWAFTMLKGAPAWVSITLSSKTGSGSISGTLLGWRPHGVEQTSAPAPPSTCPAGGNGAVQFDDSGVCGGDPTNFFWDNTAKTLSMGATVISNPPDVSLGFNPTRWRVNNPYLGDWWTGLQSFANVPSTYAPNVGGYWGYNLSTGGSSVKAGETAIGHVLEGNYCTDFGGPWTDLVVDGTNNKKVTSVSHSFVSGDVNTEISVTSGTGWTVGGYVVQSVSGGAAILNTSPAATSTAGGHFYQMVCYNESHLMWIDRSGVQYRPWSWRINKDDKSDWVLTTFADSESFFDPVSTNRYFQIARDGMHFTSTDGSNGWNFSAATGAPLTILDTNGVSNEELQISPNWSDMWVRANWLGANQTWIGAQPGAVAPALITTTVGGSLNQLAMKYASSPYPNIVHSAPSFTFQTKTAAGWPDGASFDNYGTPAMQLDGDTTSGETPVLVLDIAKGSLQRVSIGAADSCGTGFKCLRVPN